MSNQEYRERWLKKKSRPDRGCIFYSGWQGYCERNTEPYEKYCDLHLGKECWECGGQTQKSCAIQECGILECEDHPHYKLKHGGN